ncbi:MAG: hypothetical protein GYB24_01395 [Rhodobacteraceae bacterium]|nr:hypothetical protein [Paracoccaceae bacterium]
MADPTTLNNRCFTARTENTVPAGARMITVQNNRIAEFTTNGGGIASWV